MCSSITLPKTMAPSRPLPTGFASTHFSAGCRYHRTIGLEGGPLSAAAPADATSSEHARRGLVIIYTITLASRSQGADVLLSEQAGVDSSNKLNSRNRQPV